MSENLNKVVKVAEFRQTLLWPVQLIAEGDNQQIHKHWEHLKAVAGSTPWKEITDEFSTSSKQLSEARYQEFVTFMPFAQRFLYGEGKHGEDAGGYGESPIHIFSRADVSQVRIVFEHDIAPLILQVAHTELYFFFDIDVAMLVIEVIGKEVDLPIAMETLYRLGRTYPNYWDKHGDGGHCAKSVEWMNKEGEVLSVSDYQHKERYLEFVKEHHVPCVSKHWEYLMQPLVQHYSNQEGMIRYREIEYQRMPLMAYFAFDDVRQLRRGDMIRLGLVTRPWDANTLPYTEAFLRDFEDNHCYDRYWDSSMQDPWSSTRFMCTGQNFIVLGSQQHSFFTDNKIGIKSHYQNQYFLLYLIAHFQKAALLMLSDRLVQAISRLDIDNPESSKTFRLSIRKTTETFLRFTHRYWFESVSDQAVARDIFSMMHKQLENT